MGRCYVESKGQIMPILNGKKVVDLEVDGVDSRDFPDFSDAYFSSGNSRNTFPTEHHQPDR